MCYQLSPRSRQTTLTKGLIILDNKKAKSICKLFYFTFFEENYIIITTTTRLHRTLLNIALGNHTCTLCSQSTDMWVMLISYITCTGFALFGALQI